MVARPDTCVQNAGFSCKIVVPVCTKKSNNFMAIFDYICYNNVCSYKIRVF